jgi:endonuclease/exonuclease/phosphatase (EEP) superfamily protein YafD
MKEYAFTTYNIFKAHLPFARQNLGTLCAKNDFVALQEWVSDLHIHEDKHIVTCPTFTLPLQKRQTGTATISSHKPIESIHVLSKERELGIATRKSMIITLYTLHDGTVIHIANIHALNFVLNSTWKKHVDHFIEFLPKSGPLIFAGDFNTWNPWRFNYLEQALKKLRLHYAHYDHNIIMRLDHIFTRDIDVLETKEDENMHTSDHYPVTLKFKIL